MQAKEKGPPPVGVRYISEELIQKVTKQNHIDQITSLNLTLSKEVGKKIKYIENLEKLKRLQTLNLSCNMIEKMEKLDKLTKLRELNLSYNSLSKIEGIDTLVSLQSLNFTGNMIEHIPIWINKKLKSLRVFRIAKNNIQSLSEFYKLRGLKDLSQLSVAENPVCQLPHCRLFLIFNLRTLETLDGQPIDWDERTTAQARFAQDEIEHLEMEIEKRDHELSQLKEQHNRSLNELEEIQQHKLNSQQRIKHDTEKLSEVQRELETKNEMLKKRTLELTRACNKHYELEQELAFYKIDHKFEALGELPSPSSGSQEDEGPYDESPYIGKGRFRKNQMAKQRKLQAQQGTIGMAGGDEDAAAMHQQLDKELEDKHSAIDNAQDRLRNLQEELLKTEDQMLRATDELKRIAHNQPTQTLTEGDKEQIRSRLARKIDHVHLLRDEADKIEEEMAATEHEIQTQERDIGRLRGKLSSMGSRDSLYNAVSKEVADKEQRLNLTNQAYSALQRKLEDMLATIARETDSLKHLEQDLREGQAAQNDEIREELEGIVNGLQDYLSDVQSKTERQKQDMDQLIREREELIQQLDYLGEQARRLPETEAELSRLHERLGELEDSLAAQRDLNGSLARQLDETQHQHDEDEEVNKRVKDAEELLGKLRDELREKEARSKAEKDAYEKKLENERHRAAQLEKRAKHADAKEDEVHNMHHQLRDLQNANADLQQELYRKQQKMAEKGKDTTADELKGRLDDIYNALRAGKGPSGRSNDPLDRPLGDFHKKVAHELNKSSREAERARTAAVQAEAELAALQKEADREERHRRKAEMAVQAQLEGDQHDLTKLQDELDKLREELERERKPKGKGRSKEPLPFRLLEPTLRSQSTGSGSLESETETESTIPSSQWSDRKHELYEGMTPDEQDLFDELQQEIEELRRLLARKDDDAARRVADAQRKAQQLREMINTRKQRENESKDKRAKPPVDSRLRQAAEDLARAQEDIGDLHEILRKKDRALRAETANADRSQFTVAEQQKDIDGLHDILEDQRAEILKLNRLVDRLNGQPTSAPQMQDTEVQAVRQGAADIRSHIAQQGPRIHNIGVAGQTQTHPSHMGHPRETHPRYEHVYDSHDGAPPRAGLPMPQMYGQPQPPVQSMYHPEQHMPPQASMPNGLVYAPVASQQTMQMPTTPVAQRVQIGDGTYMMSAPTTPVAGSGMQTILTEPVTPMVTSASRPVMVSTPVTASAAQRLEFVDQHSPTKGILKTNKPSNIEEGLFCNVPEHHDLEDYIAKLQTKVKTLKAKRRGQEVDDDSRKVVFEEDMNQRQAVKRLKLELEERRSELEGLDLAIERQKVSLTKMKEAEKTLRLQRGATKRQLKELRDGKGIRRKAFLEDDLYYDLVESELESGVDPLSREGRKPYLMDEIDCLEETLSRRRAELREADKLIVEAEEELEDVRAQTSGIITDYKESQANLVHVVKDAEEMEKRAHETGVGLLKAQEEVEALRAETGELREEKNTHQEMLKEIMNVIAIKDAEFQELEGKLKETTNRLASAEAALSETESEQKNRLERISESEVVVANRRKEVETLSNKIDSQKRTLEQLDREMGSKNIEAEAISHTVDKRRQQMDELSQQVEKELTSKRREIKVVEDMLGELKQERFKIETDIREKDSRLAEISLKLDHEEAVLQNLAITTNKQRSDLADVKERTQQALSDLDRILEERVIAKSEHAILLEETAEMKRVRADIGQRKVDLEALKDKCERQHEELESLSSQRRAVETSINNLRQEKISLEENNKMIEKRSAQLQRTQAQAEEEIKTFHTQALSLERELRELEGDVQDARREKSAVKQQVSSLKNYLQEGQQELDRVKAQLQDTQGQVELLTKEVKRMVTKKAESQRDISRYQDDIKQMEEVRAALKEKRDKEAEQLRNLHERFRGKKIACTNIEQDLASLGSKLQHEEARYAQSVGDGRAQLDNINSEIDQGREELGAILNEITVLKREAVRRQLAEEQFGSLESRIEELAQVVAERNNEKEQLASALNRTSNELKSLRVAISKERDGNRQKILQRELEINDLQKHLRDHSEELHNHREKAAREISDLEAIAQAHYGRANRLNDELNYLRAEHLELQRQLQNQGEVIERERKLEDTLHEFKSDIKAELTGGILDMSRTQMEVVCELEQLHDQKDHIESHLHHLKQNLNYIRDTNDTDTSCVEARVPTTFEEQQDMLKRQLQQKMLRHEESLLSKRLASQDHIRNLQEKLCSLEKTLSSKFTRSNTYHATSALPLIDQKPTKDTGIPESEQTLQEGSKETPDSPTPKRAYSPNRHSMRRRHSRSQSPSPSRIPTNSPSRQRTPSPRQRSPIPHLNSESPPRHPHVQNKPPQSPPSKRQASPSPTRKETSPAGRERHRRSEIPRLSSAKPSSPEKT